MSEAETEELVKDFLELYNRLDELDQEYIKAKIASLLQSEEQARKQEQRGRLRIIQGGKQ